MPECYTLVTGAASGIGQATAKNLSSSKLLILNDKNPEGLDSTKALCYNNEKHIIWKYDLSDVEGIGSSLSSLLSDNNINIDNFVHCAGVIKVSHMRSMDYNTALNLFNVNLFSASEIISNLLKKKVNNHALKNIVFISAILGKYGAKGHNLYCASKGAIDGLMKALAVELAPGIRVNSVLPGGVRTPMSEYALNDPEIAERIKHDYPLGIGEPEDIANAVEFLLSDKARWLTGHQFVVDGGRTANMSQK